MRLPSPRVRMLATTSLLVFGLAACAGGGDGGDGGGGGGGATSTDVEADVSVTGTDALKFEPTQLAVEAGTVAIELVSGERVPHNVVIEEAGDTEVVLADQGQTEVGTIDLEPGTYTFYCGIPGHRTAGMEGILTVS